jgi:hypothetical protein
MESVVATARAGTESLAQIKRLALKTEVAKSLPSGLATRRSRGVTWEEEL